jgi:UDP-glucose 4-epimerase
MATCLVLGGAGFIGSHLADALAQAGHRVRAFDRPHVDSLASLAQRGDFAALRGDFEIVTGDFLNAGDLEKALRGSEIVFHLISTTLPQTSNDNPAYDAETNLLGTLRLLGLCRQHAVRKVIFVSSGGTVYGIPRAVPVAESHPTQPTCAYGIHKLAIEKHLYLEHLLHGLDYCVLRPANLYGERQRPDAALGAVTVFLDRALRGEPIRIWGDGSIVRDYVYVRDAVGALLAAMAYAGEEKVFNVGSGAGTSLNDLVKLIEGVMGRRVAVEYTPSRAFDVPVNVLDSSLAGRLLGWSAATPLATGIRKTYEWLRAGH